VLDTILAVGDTATVRAISRGDSRFIALPGRMVTSAPDRPSLIERSLREAVSLADGDRVRSLLASLRQPDPHGQVRRVEIGELADLAVWSSDPGEMAPTEASRFRLEALIRGGVFAGDDPIHGPYRLDPALAPQCHPGLPSG
jgi:hypothetical protein